MIELEDIFGGSSAFKIAVLSDRVEVAPLMKVSVDIGGTKYLNGAWVSLDAADVILFRAALVDRNSYDDESGCDCVADPQVRIRMYSGKDCVEVDLDIASEMLVHVSDAQGADTLSFVHKEKTIQELLFRYLFRDERFSDAYSKWLTSR